MYSVKTMLELIKKHKWSVVGAAVGSLVGYAYWYYVGCASGSCAITAYWHNSSLYGAFLGVLLGSYFPINTSNKEI
jgi:phage shock protein E